jgi:hypothetical protein
MGFLLAGGAGLSGMAKAQEVPDTISLRWTMAGDSVLHAGYEMLIQASGDQRAVAVRHHGDWLLAPQSCDSSLADSGSCAVVLRQVSDTFTLSFGAPDSAVTRPGLPPSEPMPMQLSAAGDWDVPFDWKTGPRDPVMATSEMASFLPIRFPAHPVSVGSEWPVVTTFNHQTPRKQFVDSFAGTARLDSLTGSATHPLAWLTLQGRRVGHSQFISFSMDSTTTHSSIVWDVNAGRPVRALNLHDGVSAVRDSTGTFHQVHMHVETRLLVQADSAKRRPGIIP